MLRPRRFGFFNKDDEGQLEDFVEKLQPTMSAYTRFEAKTASLKRATEVLSRLGEDMEIMEGEAGGEDDASSVATSVMSGVGGDSSSAAKASSNSTSAHHLSRSSTAPPGAMTTKKSFAQGKAIRPTTKRSAQSNKLPTFKLPSSST